MTKDEFAAALGSHEQAHIIDAYVRGLIARCRRVTVYSQAAAMGQEAPVERLKIDEEERPDASESPVTLAREHRERVECEVSHIEPCSPFEKPGMELGPEQRALFRVGDIDKAIAEAVEAERAACEAICRARAKDAKYAIAQGSYEGAADAIAARKAKAGGK